MSEPEFLDVYPDAVMRAGQATAGTAGHWRSWGGRIRTTFSHADSGLQSARILDAMETYAEGVVVEARRVSQQAENLGIGTSSAGVVVAGGDLDSTADLQQPSQAVAGQSTVLTRPVNGWSAPD